MYKLPKEIYIHWFLMIAIFTMLITALLTYILITAPIEHNQKQIVEVANYLLTECNFIKGTPAYNTFTNFTINITK